MSETLFLVRSGVLLASVSNVDGQVLVEELSASTWSNLKLNEIFSGEFRLLGCSEQDIFVVNGSVPLLNTELEPAFEI